MTTDPVASDGGPHVFVIVGEESGDQLGAALISSLRQQLSDLRVSGIGGERMAELGLRSIFPLADIAVMGFSAVIARLPLILRRIKDTVKAIDVAKPDILILIDSPDFTHRVARRVRAGHPDILIINYVSPSVWAWRPGRAAKMARYIDLVLAILPFEPEVHRRLGGPHCVYVGHPIIEKLKLLRPGPGERLPLDKAERPVLLVMPGSREGEVVRHMPAYRDVVQRLHNHVPSTEIIIPAVPNLESEIEAQCRDWPMPVSVVTGEEAKFAAFRRAHAALVASGTATLELALSAIPMVVAYRLELINRLAYPHLHRFPKLFAITFVALPNIILGRKAVPEWVGKEATVDQLANSLIPLLEDSEERQAQMQAFSEIDQQLAGADESAPPSDRAANAVIAKFARWRGANSNPEFID